MRINQDTNGSEGFSLTPMIDVVFLLLIFFLVATRFEEQEKELDSRLPEVLSAQPITEKVFIVNITKDGRYKVVQKEFNHDQLFKLIKENHRINKHQDVMIRADGRSAMKYCARVMGICNKVGVEYKLAAILEQ